MHKGCLEALRELWLPNCNSSSLSSEWVALGGSPVATDRKRSPKGLPWLRLTREALETASALQGVRPSL